jgi:hypothetical protein
MASLRYRRLHARRIPDLMMGSILNGMKKKARELAIRAKVSVADSKTKFNDVLRANSPSIYLVDPQLIATTIISALFSNDGNNKYISKIYSKPSGSDSRIPLFSDSPQDEKRFARVVRTFKKVNRAEISNFQNKLEKSIADALITDFNKINTATLLNTAKTTYFAMLRELQQAERKKNKVYADFRAAAAKAGAEIRRELNIVGISVIEDPENMIQNLNNRIPFVAFNFNQGVKNINVSVQKALDKEFKAFSDLVEFNKVEVGNLVHAGHVGIYQDNSLLGINMPSGVIAGIASNNLQNIENAIGSLPLHVEHGIRLTKKFAKRAGVFLDLQFNFVVSMEGSFNSAILGPQEQAAIRGIVGQVGEQALIDVIKSRSGAEAFAEVANMLPVAESSKTLVDYIKQSLIETLTGREGVDYTQKSKFKGTGLDVNKLTSAALSKNRTKSKAKARSKVTAKPNIVVQPKSALNLSSLLNLINSDLHDQIKRNMGTGNRRDVLNYQTGRFASSAKVERLSESRQGMLTAFYSYMKNPYSTFSQGGRQQNPRSRDPKTLIAKSIREIAQTMVTNQLRAVNV